VNKDKFSDNTLPGVEGYLRAVFEQGEFCENLNGEVVAKNVDFSFCVGGK